MERAPVNDPFATALDLLSYCAAEHWAGHDPYDALNSRVFEALPLLNRRLPRLVATQALKRSPLNLRWFARIPKTQNPKALALFLASVLRMPGLAPLRRSALVESMIGSLVELRSPGAVHWCWGYSFPWQTRTVVVPRWAPNLVCTTFVADALVDAYERHNDRRCLDMALSAADYIVNELYWTDGSAVSSFSYPLPSHRVPIHNANLLAAALLCRVANHVGDSRFSDVAFDVARYSAGRQQPDGSWLYGEHPTLAWIDNFHTGYNLCALRTIAETTGTSDFDEVLERGHEFYRTHFIREDGAARYFHNHTYPIDVHCVAQTMITLRTLADLDRDNARRAHQVFLWAMAHLWDRRGFFYYRQLRTCTIRTSYMRWSQAWMLRAIVSLLNEPQKAVSAALRPATAFA